MLSMPLSRPMPSIGRGVHELRLKDRSGVYRVVYALVRRGTVHVLHAFKKTTQTTALKNLELARKRLKEVLS
jgi:phage-related protein